MLANLLQTDHTSVNRMNRAQVTGQAKVITISWTFYRFSTMLSSWLAVDFWTIPQGWQPQNTSAWYVAKY